MPSAVAGQVRSDRPQSYSASPYQNPRVRNSLGSSSSAQSSPRFNSTGNINNNSNLYANAVPTSSPSQQSPRSRPPVPLFVQSAGAVPTAQNKMAQLHSHFGIDSAPPRISTSPDLTPPITDMTTDFDFAADGLHSTPSDFFDATSAGNISFDNPSFDSVNSSTSNVQTVSPKDIVMDVNFTAPPSAALTNLSTPQTLAWDSPFEAALHSNDTSPIFYDNDEDLGAESANWTSLFPTESPSDIKPSIEAASPVVDGSPTMTRTHSSPGGRLSSVAGVKKSRSRNKPLVDLHPEHEPDAATKKRMRNTLAARKSRDKRARERDDHLDEIDQLRHELDQTKAELDRYKALFKQQVAQQQLHQPSHLN